MAKIPLPVAAYVDLRIPNRDRRGKLLARYDQARGVLEFQVDGMKYYFDLTQSPITVEVRPQAQQNTEPDFG